MPSRRDPELSGPLGPLGSLLAAARKPVGIALIADREVSSCHVVGAPAGARFQAGSISKCLTAFAVLELAGGEGIDIDSEVNQHLRAWRVPRAGVTIRQLLGHTAGASVPFFPGYEEGSDMPSVTEVLDGASSANTEPVTFDPSKQGRCYSGGAFVVLQQMVMDVTGVAFAEAARRPPETALSVLHWASRLWLGGATSERAALAGVHTRSTVVARQRHFPAGARWRHFRARARSGVHWGWWL